MVSEGTSDKVIFEQRPKENKEASMCTFENSIPGKGNKIKESRSCLHVSETLRLPVCSEHNEGGTSGKGPGQGIGGTKACSSWQGKSEENPLEGF